MSKNKRKNVVEEYEISDVEVMLLKNKKEEFKKVQFVSGVPPKKRG